METNRGPDELRQVQSGVWEPTAGGGSKASGPMFAPEPAPQRRVSVERIADGRYSGEAFWVQIERAGTGDYNYCDPAGGWPDERRPMDRASAELLCKALKHALAAG